MFLIVLALIVLCIEFVRLLCLPSMRSLIRDWGKEAGGKKHRTTTCEFGLENEYCLCSSARREPEEYDGMFSAMHLKIYRCVRLLVYNACILLLFLVCKLTFISFTFLYIYKYI